MVHDLIELSTLVTKVASHILDLAAKNTTTGDWPIEYDDVAALISEEDYLMYFDFIASELAGRPEIMDIDYSDQHIDCRLHPQYCPKYEWCDGDEITFGYSHEVWERTFHARPISQPLCMSRLAEIGQAAIDDTLENSEMAIELLTESFGMSMAELDQIGVYAPDSGSEQAKHAELVNDWSRQAPILFYAHDNTESSLRVPGYERFEEAAQNYERLTGTDKTISFLAFDEQGRGHGAIIVAHDELRGNEFCHLSRQAIRKNPYIAMAQAKAILYCSPDDQDAQQMLQDAEHRIQSLSNQKWLSQMISAAESKSLAIAEEGNRPKGDNHDLNR